MALPSNDEWMTAIQNAPKLSKCSKRSYAKQIKAVLRACDLSGPLGISTVMFNVDDHLPALSKVPDHTLRTHLSAIVAMFKRGEEASIFKRCHANITKHHRAWSEELFKSRGRYKVRIEDNKPSDRELEARSTMADWGRALKFMQETEPDSQAALLVAFHALALPPLRGGDLSHVRIGETMTGNFIRVYPDSRCLAFPEGRAKLVIREHKSAATYGDLVRELPAELIRLLLRSVRAEPREWLFTTKALAPYSDSGFSAWKCRMFHKAFEGRPGSTNSLRHADISEVDRQHQTIREARELAKAMGHSLQMQREYVRL